MTTEEAGEGEEEEEGEGGGVMVVEGGGTVLREAAGEEEEEEGVTIVPRTTGEEGRRWCGSLLCSLVVGWSVFSGAVYIPSRLIHQL